MKAENENLAPKVPEIPNETSPSQVLRALSLELRHLTNSAIGYAAILQKLYDEQRNDQQAREEVLSRISIIAQHLKEIFVQVDKYLDTCKPKAKLQDEDFEADKTALLIFSTKFKRHIQPVETWVSLLQQSDVKGKWEYESGLVQIRQNVETLENLRISTHTEYK